MLRGLLQDVNLRPTGREFTFYWVTFSDRRLEGYDLAFLGFPIHNYGPDRKARRLLERQTMDQKMALFITHASPESQEELAGHLAKFRDAGVFARDIMESVSHVEQRGNHGH